MRALVCNAYGSTDDLRIEDYDDPVASDGQVIVDIQAAGINFPSILVAAGQYQDKTPPPFVPGNEAAGIFRGRRKRQCIRRWRQGHCRCSWRRVCGKMRR